MSNEVFKSIKIDDGDLHSYKEAHERGDAIALPCGKYVISEIDEANEFHRHTVVILKKTTEDKRIEPIRFEGDFVFCEECGSEVSFCKTNSASGQVYACRQCRVKVELYRDSFGKVQYSKSKY